MPQHVIITRSSLAANAIRQVLTLTGTREAGLNLEHEALIEVNDFADATGVFEKIFAWIVERTLQGNSSATEVVAIVDEVCPLSLSPTSPDVWNAAIAMCILACPEVKWVFGNIVSQTVSLDEDEVFRNHTLSNCFTSTTTHLFDGTGLRNWVRVIAGKRTALGYLAERSKAAAALDEESSYAYLHAYAAYRFGYRVHCITTLASAAAIYGKTAGASSTEVAFEDIYLAFSDQEEGVVHLSHLWAHEDHEEGESRRDILPGLEYCMRRVIVSGAHTKASDPETWKKNEEELRNWSLRNGGRPFRVIGKPTAGIFDLWEQANLGRWGGWPPKADERVLKWPRHSAPGRLKVVAESLLYRANRLAEDARRVPEVVRVAVLARDAMELIGHRTPTLAAEALALTHEMEVKAECEFAGVQYHFAVAPRISDLQRETRSMANWIDPTQRETFVLNAQAAVMTRLMRVFREYGQFDEEQLCLVKLRELNRKLLVSRKPWLKPAEPLMWYLELLLRSLPHFFGAILIWLLGLTCLFFADSLRLDDLANGLNFARIYDSSWVAFQTFFSVQPPQLPAGFPMPSTGLIGFAMLAGVSHIGVFISHMYAMISRR